MWDSLEGRRKAERRRAVEGGGGGGEERTGGDGKLAKEKELGEERMNVIVIISFQERKELRWSWGGADM